MEIFISIVGGLGIGTGIWSLIERIFNYKLEKNKIIFEKKFQAFSELSENILGMGLQDKIEKNVFETLSLSTKARLLIEDKKLNSKIHNYFINLDGFASLPKEKRSDKSFYKIQKEGREIFIELSENLKNTL